MKLNIIRKSARYALGYGCSIKKFKKLVRSYHDDNIKRIPARLLAKICKEEKRGYPTGISKIRGKIVTHIWLDEV